MNWILRFSRPLLVIVFLASMVGCPKRVKFASPSAVEPSTLPVQAVSTPEEPEDSSCHRADWHGFTAEESRSIAVAREAIESRDGKRLNARYSVSRSGDGYSVYVQYVAEPGFVMPAGSFCVVKISKDWQVEKITGGA